MKLKIIIFMAALTLLGQSELFAATEQCVDEPIGSSSCATSTLTPAVFEDWNSLDWLTVSDSLLTTYQASSEGLLLRSEFGAWYMGDNGALIAKGVGGNVAITTHVRASSLAGDGPPTTPYSSAGLVLAVPGDAAANNIMLDTGTQWNQSGLLLRSTLNNNTNFTFQTGSHDRWLRLCRIGTDINALSSDDDGNSWQLQQSWPRPDIPSHVLLGVATNAWNGPVDLEAEISHISYFTPIDSQDCARSLNPVEPPPEEPPVEEPTEQPVPIVFPFDDASELNDWNLLHETEERAALHSSLEIDQGRLSLQLINSGWWMSDVAPLVYRDIEGDFIVTASVIADSLQTPGTAPVSWYNSAGLLVRNGMETENWANLVVGTREVPNQMTHTRTDSSVSQSDVWASALAVEMRVCRINGELHWLSREAPTDAWVVRDVESIVGWPASLQVGMAATAWFGQTPDINAQFESFQINLVANEENCYAQTDAEPEPPIEPPEEPIDPTPETPVILMFVPYNDAWWAEYIVTYQALTAAGFEVDVRSDIAGVAATYGNAVDNTSAGSVGGNPVDYRTFLTSYNQTLGSEFPWQVGFNPISSIPIDGALQDVASMDNYAGLYIVGGTGIEQYRMDGSYAASVPSIEAATSIIDPGSHTLSAGVIEATAVQLQSLVNQTLLANKPVAAICHASLIMPYMRRTDIPDPGPDGLGVSILSGGEITGFALNSVPQDTVVDEFATLGVNFVPEERVVISSPAWLQASQIHDKLISGSNWYPETVAYTAKTFINTVKTTPDITGETINVLVFGGDEPSHYLPVEPLVYTDLADTLSNATGAWNFNVTATNNIADITLENLSDYDVLVYFRHNNMPQALEDAVRNFADSGGGVVGLHHALFNHQSGNQTLVEMFGAELPGNVGLNDSEVAYTLSNYPLFNVNLGHFITTHRVNRAGVATGDRIQINAYPLSNPNIDNVDSQGYYSTTIFAPDEIYAASHFFDVEFGEHVNAINPLVINGVQLANGLTNDGAYLASGGWTRLYDFDGDGVMGRIVYLQPGETLTGTWSNPDYQQMFVNSVVWAASNESVAVDNPLEADLIAPVPVISSNSDVLTHITPIPISIDFGEIVTDFTVEDIEIFNGIADSFATLDSQVFTLNIQPISEGSVIVNIAASVAQDVAENPNQAAVEFLIDYETAAQDPVATVYLQQNFDGLANGDPWPAPWVPAENSPIVSATIQNGQACLSGPVNNGDALQNVLARMVTNGVNLQDIDARFDVTYENFHQQGVGFYGRQNGGFLTETTPSGQGYAMFLEGGNQDCLGLWYELDGDEIFHECTNAAQTLGLDLNENTGSIAADVTFSIRYQIEQISATETMQRAKVWISGTDEPDSWQVISDPIGIEDPATNPITVPALQNISGGLVLDLYNYSGGGTSSACFDNIIISELSENINPIASDEEVVELVSGYGFTEGVTWHSESQQVLFTDITNDQIFQLNPADASVTLFRDSSAPLKHANGLATDATGNLLIAEQSLQAIVRRNADGSEQILVDNWQGTNFNSPNDLVRHSNSTLYFTDPSYGTFFNPALSQPLGFQAVYRLLNDGSLTQIANDFSQPNGIALSPDQSRLYVSDTGADEIRVFALQADGTLLQELNEETMAVAGNVDGLAVDVNGNIFVAINEGVQVLRPDGSSWGIIPVPETVRNISFGGVDFKDLYIAAGSSIYRTRTEIAGLNILADDEAEAPPVPPPAPIVTVTAPLTPNGDIDAVPTNYTWQADPNAIWYAVVVQDNTGLYPINIGTSPEDAGCGNGTNICSINTDIPLASGVGQWWVRVWLPDEIQVWSVEQSFVLANIDDGGGGPVPPPEPSTSPETDAAARFLMQATFGPTLAEIEALTQSDFDTWIDTQMALPATYQLPQLQASGLFTPKERLRISWNTPIFAADQLRQRVAMALSEILVVSDVGNLGTGSTTGAGMAAYNDLLVEHAFGNYRDLLQDIVLSPIMGIYLSMMNNERPNAALNIRADENFSREVQQLFSIGLEMLNIDGTVQLDQQGQVIATYGHEHIKGLARVFTGWTWADAPNWRDTPNPPTWEQPMAPFVDGGEQVFHDPDSKTILGHQGINSETVIPAGLTAENELTLALDTLFNHPNVGPFISKALIQRLVTSNPSPAYVERVATLFNDNGAGVRGDLSAVVRAILLDEEARLGHQQQPETFGKLREPMLRLWHLWRTFNATTTINGQVAEFDYLTSNLTQGPYHAPSVFNFFQPNFRSPDIDEIAGPQPYVGPEFQINTESRLTNYQVLLSQFTHSGYVGAANPTFYNIAINLDQAVDALLVSNQSLLDYLDIVLMAGQMSNQMRSSLLNYMAGLSDLAGLNQSQRGLRAAHMIYLIMSSPQYLIQR